MLYCYCSYIITSFVTANAFLWLLKKMGSTLIFMASLFDYIIKAKEAFTKVKTGIVGVSSTEVVDESRLPVLTEWFYTAMLGQPRNIDVKDIRSFAKSAWVQMVTNTISKEVRQIEWDIVMKNEEEDIAPFKKDIERFKSFLVQTLFNKSGWNGLLTPMMFDLLEIDSGVWVKVFSEDSYESVELEEHLNEGYKDEDSSLNLSNGLLKTQVDKLKPFGKRQLIGLVPADGVTFLKNVSRQNILKNWWQYSFKHPRAAPKFFDKDEVAYFVMNQRSYHIYGFSPLQAVQQVVEILTQATRWNKDFYKNNAIPNLLIGIKNANKDFLKYVKDSWNNEIKGKPHKVFFTNGEPTVDKLVNSNRDMEWLDGQKWYMHLVFGAYGLSPTEAGFHETTNRSSQEGQERVTVKNAIIPYLESISNVVNNDVTLEYFQKEELPFVFKFFPKDHAQAQIEHTQLMAELDKKVLTINEFRTLKGRLPLPSEKGDDPFFVDPSFQNSDSFSFSKPDPKGEREDGEAPPARPNKKSVSGTREDMRVVSGEYETFFNKQLSKWEKLVVGSVENNELGKKSFGGFLSDLFNVVNTLPFMNEVKRLVLKSMKGGLENVERELGMDVGVSEEFSKRANWLADQQLNGYSIHGRKWPGIKGVTSKLQLDILSSLKDGMTNKESSKELVKRVKKEFKTVSNTSAERISRTETTRIVNQGKCQGYNDSGLDGELEWVSIIDGKTSSECKELDGQKVRIGGLFRLKDGREFEHPPAHVSCRSCIIFNPF